MVGWTFVRAEWNAFTFFHVPLVVWWALLNVITHCSTTACFFIPISTSTGFRWRLRATTFTPIVGISEHVTSTGVGANSFACAFFTIQSVSSSTSYWAWTNAVICRIGLDVGTRTFVLADNWITFACFRIRFESWCAENGTKFDWLTLAFFVVKFISTCTSNVAWLDDRFTFACFSIEFVCTFTTDVAFLDRFTSTKLVICHEAWSTSRVARTNTIVVWIRLVFWFSAFIFADQLTLALLTVQFISTCATNSTRSDRFATTEFLVQLSALWTSYIARTDAVIIRIRLDIWVCAFILADRLANALLLVDLISR